MNLILSDEFVMKCKDSVIPNKTIPVPVVRLINTITDEYYLAASIDHFAVQWLNPLRFALFHQ